MLRFAALAVLALVGCQDDNQRLDTGESRLAALEARVTAAEATAGSTEVVALRQMVTAQQQQLAQLAADLAAAKMQLAKGGTLHRVGPDGEDLGIGAPGSSWVWIPEGEIDLSMLFNVYFDGPDCTGNKFIATGLRQGQLALAADGDVYAVDPSSMKFGGEWLSQLDKDERKCVKALDPLSQSGGYAKWRKVTHYPVIGVTDTHLEIR